MELRNNGLRLPPPWITPAAGKVDREVRPVIYANRRKPPASSTDPDAQALIAAIEAADGQSLEPGGKDALNAYFLGVKTDGVFPLLQNVLILRNGARTLTGVMIPAVGPSAINNNFVLSDYNRKTGLKGRGATVGSGATVWLRLGMLLSELAQNSHAIYVHGLDFETTSELFPCLFGYYQGVNSALLTDIISSGNGLRYFRDYGGASITRTAAGGITANGSVCFSRTAPNLVTAYQNGVSIGTSTAASVALPAVAPAVFARWQENPGFPTYQTTARLAVFAATQGMTGAQVAAFHARTETYLAAMAAAIP